MLVGEIKTQAETVETMKKIVNPIGTLSLVFLLAFICDWIFYVTWGELYSIMFGEWVYPLKMISFPLIMLCIICAEKNIKMQVPEKSDLPYFTIRCMLRYFSLYLLPTTLLYAVWVDAI